MRAATGGVIKNGLAHLLETSAEHIAKTNGFKTKQINEPIVCRSEELLDLEQTFKHTKMVENFFRSIKHELISHQKSICKLYSHPGRNFFFILSVDPHHPQRGCWCLCDLNGYRESPHSLRLKFLEYFLQKKIGEAKFNNFRRLLSSYELYLT